MRTSDPRTPKGLITAQGSSQHALVSAHDLLLLGAPGEQLVGDLLHNPSRRVRAAQNGIYISAIAGGSVVELAETRTALATVIPHKGEVELGVIRVTMTDAARRLAGPDAGLRLLDLREDPERPTLQALHEAGQSPNSAEWRALDMIRDELALVGYILPSDSATSTTIILDLHAITLLRNAGLLEFEIDHGAVQLSRLQRFRLFTQDVHDWCDAIVFMVHEWTRVADALRDWAVAMTRLTRAMNSVLVVLVLVVCTVIPMILHLSGVI